MLEETVSEVQQMKGWGDEGFTDERIRVELPDETPRYNTDNLQIISRVLEVYILVISK